VARKEKVVTVSEKAFGALIDVLMASIELFAEDDESDDLIARLHTLRKATDKAVEHGLADPVGETGTEG